MCHERVTCGLLTLTVGLFSACNSLQRRIPQRQQRTPLPFSVQLAPLSFSPKTKEIVCNSRPPPVLDSYSIKVQQQTWRHGWSLSMYAAPHHIHLELPQPS